MSLSPQDITLIKTINVERVLEDIQYLSTGVVNNPNGTGKGTAVAGTSEEHKMAHAIKEKFEEIGLDKVELEDFPVQTYKYGPVMFRANCRVLPAISLHGASGTYGTRYGLPFALGNTECGRMVISDLVDANLGTRQDYEAIGDVTGKVVIIRRLLWPVYEIIEAALRGAAALIVWGYGEDEDEVRSDLLRQDAMYNHLQLPVAAISKDTYLYLKSLLDAGRNVEVELENRVDITDGISHNVVATYKGCLFPDEYIVCSAHYDRWFVAAADNCSGVAAILELARMIVKGERPNRTFIFIAVGAEEVGIYDSTNDWLAGSFSYANMHPHIWRNIAHAINFDIYGWTNDRTSHQTSGELIPFQNQVVAEAQNKLGVTLPVEITEYNNSNVDAWVYCKVAGGGIVFQGSTRLFGQGAPDSVLNYALYYHTNGDIFEPKRFQLLEPELYYSATGLILADKLLIVPIKLSSILTSLTNSLNTSITANPEVDYAQVQAALAELKVEVSRVESIAEDVKDPKRAALINKLLMNARKEFLPWLYSASGYRITLYNRIYASLRNVLAAAERNDRAATLAAILAIRGSGWWTVQMNKLSQFSPQTVERERLYYYVNGDWRSAYDQRALLVGEDIDRIYYRLENEESTPLEEVPLIRELLDHILVQLKETLTITEGKLEEAVEYFDRYFHPHILC